MKSRKYNRTKPIPVRPIEHVIGPSIAYVVLPREMYALIAAEDTAKVAPYNWNCSVIGGKFYVKRNLPKKQGCEYLHQLLVRDGEGRVVDHADRNELNNAFWNLRRCSDRQNLGNCKTHDDNASGFKGVYTYKNRSKPYAAKIRNKHIGYFYQKVEAARAYDKAAIEEFGKFARLNNV